MAEIDPSLEAEGLMHLDCDQRRGHQQALVGVTVVPNMSMVAFMPEAS